MGNKSGHGTDGSLVQTSERDDSAPVQALLAKSEERYKTFLRTSHEGIWCFELPHPVRVDLATSEQVERILRDAYLAECNDAMARMYGHDRAEELIGRSLTQFLPDEDTARAMLEQFVVAGHQLRDQESHELDREGKPHTFLNNCAGVIEEGQLLRIWGMQIEVTAQRQVEREREQLLVRERAARLEAERATRARDEFLATLSHELRSPLNSLLGWVQLLQTGVLPVERTQEALGIIERNALAEAQLINDLLDVSRFETGAFRLERTAVHLGDLLESALQTIRNTAESNGIALVVSIEPRLGMVSGDSRRLQQVVSNLLSNSLKFTPRGGTVSASLQDVGLSLELRVSDTGVGIPGELLPHVFERFFQADPTTTRRHGGLGLGLTIVRYLVELHGGSVTAFSSGPGMGATFVVRLPVLQEKRDDPGVATRTTTTAVVRSADEPLPGSLVGLSVLVVEDAKDSRAFLEALLRSQGAAVISAGSVQEALDALANQPVDLVITDIGMPSRDGFDLLSMQQQSRQQHREIPVLAVTGYATRDDANRALKAGFAGHVAKPVDPRELVNCVARIMHLRSIA